MSGTKRIKTSCWKPRCSPPFHRCLVHVNYSFVLMLTCGHRQPEDLGINCDNNFSGAPVLFLKQKITNEWRETCSSPINAVRVNIWRANYVCTFIFIYVYERERMDFFLSLFATPLPNFYVRLAGPITGWECRSVVRIKTYRRTRLNEGGSSEIRTKRTNVSSFD